MPQKVLNREAVITVNGSCLDVGQSTTVRVALEQFASSLAEKGLGNDEHGREMTAAYIRRIQEIRKLMYGRGL